MNISSQARDTATCAKINAQELRSILTYLPDIGEFRWRVSRGPGARPGSPAGTACCGGRYRKITINGTQYQEHRLVWLYVHGVWPPAWIDHINRDGCDNRLTNLRLSTPAENAANRRAHRNSRAGLKGVLARPNGTWCARIMKAGKSRFLGSFNNPEDAHNAYVLAANRLFGEFANPGN